MADGLALAQDRDALAIKLRLPASYKLSSANAAAEAAPVD